MNFKEILTQISHDFEMKLDDLCFAVSTKDFDFPFSFFVDETDDFLIVSVTDSEGLEKLHVVVKSEIVYLRIHYFDEIQMLFDDEDIERFHKIRLYE